MDCGPRVGGPVGSASVTLLSLMLLGLRSADAPALRVLVCAAVGALVLSSALHAPLAQTSDLATCPDGTQHEKLTCDSRIKLSKCFDAEITCGKWDVKDCCSPIALHKCLSPLAGRAFDADCSSPIDAREECCADPVTHRRSFQSLAELEQLTKEAASKTSAAVNSAIKEAGLEDDIEAAKSKAKEGLQAASESLEAAKAKAKEGIETARTEAIKALGGVPVESDKGVLVDEAEIV